MKWLGTQDQNPNLPPPGRLGKERKPNLTRCHYFPSTMMLCICAQAAFSAVLCIPMEEKSAGFTEEETRDYRGAKLKVT